MLKKLGQFGRGALDLKHLGGFGYYLRRFLCAKGVRCLRSPYQQELFKHFKKFSRRRSTMLQAFLSFLTVHQYVVLGV